MNCAGCRGETIDTEWGPWCDGCGGVMIGYPARLFFRHVASVKGSTGIYPIVYDISADAYGVAWPRKIRMVKCIHCGMETPDNEKKGLAKLDDLRNLGWHSTRGPLDAIIAIIQPIAQGDSSELPELSPAPTATNAERRIVIGE